MELMTTGNLISALFIYGFEEVDHLLYAFTLERIAYLTAKDKNFKILYFEPLDTRLKYFCYDNLYHKFRLNKNNKDAVEVILKVGDKTLEYLNNIDFHEIMEKKMKALGITKDEVSNSFYFCKKEKEIIDSLYDKKEKVIDKIIAGLDKENPHVKIYKDDEPFFPTKENIQEKVKQLEKVLDSDLYKKVIDE